MDVGELRPRERAEELSQPVERDLRALHGDAPAPALLVARLIEHVHQRLLEPAAFVAIVGRHRQREMMHRLGVPQHPLVAGRQRGGVEIGEGAITILPRAGATHLALHRGVGLDPVLHRSRAVLVGAGPPRVATYRHARRAEHLVLGHVDLDAEGAELAIELARRDQRMLFPSVPVVHHHLGIPLGEVVMPSLPPLPAGDGGESRVPVHLDHHRVAGCERRRQREPHDGAVGRQRIAGGHGAAHDPHVAHVVVRVVGILEVVEPPPPFHRVHVAPARAWPEGIEVQVQREGPQRIGRVVHVLDPLRPPQHAERLLEARGDVVRNALLPVGRGPPGHGIGRRGGEQDREERDHGGE
ncbi:MAG: hypothetical protein H6Q77_2388 [Gemmatimonadetes bacterium]|nr:hypothetical protein [Gemmatimonadota bacterium]